MLNAMKWAIVLILAAGVVFSSCNKLLYFKHSNRIAGGVEATPHEIPSILNRGGGCAATLIHPEWALTAAHCVPFEQLVAGDHFIYEDDGTEQEIKVTETFVHPEYEFPTKNSNDAALLKLERPFQLNEYVQVAKLAPRNFKPTGQALVAGWGQDEYEGYPEALYKVTVPLVTQDECIAAFGSDVDDSMICAGSPGKDACVGDSGGPLFCDSPNGTVHCGIVSWGRVDCGHADYPGVYARTSHFLDWIQQTTGITA